jgi:DUF4097 and DUF4098 domain-containing protein YvlB
MKPMSASTGLILAVCAIAFAQDTGDRIVVPARNTGHPRVVNCDMLNGSITVKAYGGKDVTVEGGHSSSHEAAPHGMRRIGESTRGLEVTEEDNVINVHMHPAGNGDVTITVPVDTSLRLKTLSGAINVEGVRGEVEVHTLNGQLRLTNISGTVSADSQNGEIKVSMDSVDAGKPLAFSTMNGLVDLTLPPDLKANLTVKTNHGAVYSDFDVTLGGSRVLSEKNGSPDGRYRIRIDDTIRGTINGGGVDLTIRTLNGGIYIRKKK